MFNRQRYTTAERKQLREALTAEIIEDVEAAVNELLAETPPEWPVKTKDEIRKTVLEHAGWVLDALTLDELQSRVARQIHLLNATSELGNLIQLQADQDRRKSQ